MKKIILSIMIMNGLAMMLNGQSVVNSMHNLSVSGPGSVRAETETEICIFCHTPHNSIPSTPLWNRNDAGATYTLYKSSTLQAIPGQPDGSSILCLSCHDGTIALGSVSSRTADISFSGGVTMMPTGTKNLSTDISDDHPISFIYNASLASADGQLKNPAAISPPVGLENGKMQCTSCHDPHNDAIGKFLLVSNQFSELCFRCHDRDYWAASSHNSSSATWAGDTINPWFHTPYSTVSENACENCHNPHNAGGGKRLMNYQREEDNCLSCHNGKVASTNILSQLGKAYKHNVALYNGEEFNHKPDENAVSPVQHVECEDCHNPHAVRNSAASAPNANGFLEGVRGVDQDGFEINPVRYEYELCYRCHADSPFKPGSLTLRQIDQNNVRLEFDVVNPSYHPVVGPGQNNDSPSLISPWTETSVMYCTDCHASDGSSPAGPHGSSYQSLLKYQYITADNTSESYSNYELCYRCHDQNSILSDDSFEYHEKHINGEETPCNACHDPHGINSGDASNHTHLINFDTDIVSPEQGVRGWFKFVDGGTNRGTCYLKCHDQNHPGWDYGF